MEELKEKILGFSERTRTLVKTSLSSTFNRPDGLSRVSSKDVVPQDS